MDVEKLKEEYIKKIEEETELNSNLTRYIGIKNVEPTELEHEVKVDHQNNKVYFHTFHHGTFVIGMEYNLVEKKWGSKFITRYHIPVVYYWVDKRIDEIIYAGQSAFAIERVTTHLGNNDTWSESSKVFRYMQDTGASKSDLEVYMLPVAYYKMICDGRTHKIIFADDTEKLNYIEAYLQHTLLHGDKFFFTNYCLSATHDDVLKAEQDGTENIKPCHPYKNINNLTKYLNYNKNYIEKMGNLKMFEECMEWWKLWFDAMGIENKDGFVTIENFLEVHRVGGDTFVDFGYYYFKDEMKEQNEIRVEKRYLIYDEEDERVGLWG